MPAVESTTPAHPSRVSVRAVVSMPLLSRMAPETSHGPGREAVAQAAIRGLRVCIIDALEVAAAVADLLVGIGEAGCLVGPLGRGAHATGPLAGGFAGGLRDARPA